jgi:hypothetical protein
LLLFSIGRARILIGEWKCWFRIAILLETFFNGANVRQPARGKGRGRCCFNKGSSGWWLRLLFVGYFKIANWWDWKNKKVIRYILTLFRLF